MKLFNDKEMYNKKLNEIELIFQIMKPIFVFFIVTIVVVIIASVYGTISSNTVSVNDNIMLINLISQIISLIIVYFMYKKDKKLYPKVEGKLSINLIYGGLFVLAVGIISGYLMDFINYFYPKFGSGYENIDNMISNSNFIIVFISTCLLAPILEEIMFRGLILNNLLSKRSIWYSILLTSVLFGFIHLNMLQGVNAFILGISLSLVYVKTRNIYACILGHFLNNVVAIFAAYTGFGNITYDIINVILIILCVYPMLRFIKLDSIKISKC